MVLQRRIRRAMMDLKPALALPKGFLLVGLEKSDEILTLTVVSTRYSHWTWWINRPTLSRPTSGRFLVRRQSREAFSSQSETLSKFFC